MTTLGVFFTRGVSLRNWVTAGLFDREVLIYHAHLASGFFSRIYWITYGVDDTSVASELHTEGRLSKDIEVVPCPQWFRFAGRASSTLYSILMPIFVGRMAMRCNVLKTNQMDGSLPALVCAWIWRRPLYIRTGFTLSRIVEKTSPDNWLRCAIAYSNEYLAFRFASASSVSSRYDRKYVVKRYGVKVESRLNTVGNYVDTKLFSPLAGCEAASDRLLYVGRLSPEKNLDNAILACATVGLKLDVIGTGPDLTRLKSIAAQCDAEVRWLGVIQNNALPALFKGYRYFILPSLWEGLPKALIEAMSAGLVCIGNDTTGINEIIHNDVTGYLSPSSDAAAIAKTLIRALAGDYESISRAGKEFVCREFSLEAIAEKEQTIFKKLLSSR